MPIRFVISHRVAPSEEKSLFAGIVAVADFSPKKQDRYDNSAKATEKMRFVN